MTNYTTDTKELPIQAMTTPNHKFRIFICKHNNYYVEYKRALFIVYGTTLL